jgi:hypothetical protein
MPRGEIMIKIDEGLSEFEFSSGWKKMIKDNSKDRISEEFKVKIEDMQMKLENLNSTIASLSIKEMVKEKMSPDDINFEKIIMKKIDKLEISIVQIEDKVNNIQSNVIQYKNLMDIQNSMLSEIMDILKNRENTDAASQKGFIANIFKKK